MREIVENQLWVKKSKLNFLGLQIGTRMTVVRIAGSGLLVHSPVALTDEAKQELDALGRVEFVVSPNKMHHFFMDEYFQKYPGAQIFASPGLREKRKDLPFKYLLKDGPEPQWADFLDQTIFYCGDSFREVVFYHRATKTLIVADMVINFMKNAGLFTTFVLSIVGAYKKPTTPVEKQLTASQHSLAVASLDRILEWDFDRVILAHGEIIETGGKKVVSELYEWLR